MSLLMQARWLLLAITFLTAPFAVGQSLDQISDELVRMGKADQERGEVRKIEARYGYDSPEYRAAWDKQNSVDAANMQQLAAFIAAAGWPKQSAVGKDGATAAFLILQHASLEMQKKYMSAFKAAVDADEASGSSYAVLYDRVLMSEGKKQVYGSQLRRNEVSGGWYLWPVADKEHVNERRASLGMSSLEKSLSGVPVKIGAVPEEVNKSLVE